MNSAPTSLAAPQTRCVLRFDDQDADAGDAEDQVPDLLHWKPVSLDRIRYTVNVTAETNMVTATTNHRLLRRRGSGKVFAFWSAQRSVTITTTKTGLILCRTRQGKSAPSSKYLFSTAQLNDIAGWLVDSDDDAEGAKHRRKLRRAVSKAVSKHCGAFPDPVQRWPLLAAMARNMDEDTSVGDVVQCTPPAVRIALCDADRWADAVRALFGTSRYRRSMTRAITGLLAECTGPAGRDLFEDRCWLIEHLWAYRGLVPVDWIIDTLTSFQQAHGSTKLPSSYLGDPAFKLPARERRTFRAVLRQLPTPVLRRILAETHTNPQMVSRVWGDVVQKYRDFSVVADAVTARGQRNIRDIRGLEQLILRLPKPEVPRDRSRSRATGEVLADEEYQEQARDEYNHFCRQGRASVGWNEWIANKARFIAELNEHEKARKLERDRAEYNQALPAGTAPVTQQQWLADTEHYQAELHQQRAEAAADWQAEQDARDAERARLRRAHDAAAEPWVSRTRPHLDGVPLSDGYRVAIATEARTLSDWALALSNCIDGYDRWLSTSLLGAVVDADGTAVANFQVLYRGDTDSGVLDQIFGRFNRGVLHTIEQPVVDELLALFEAHGITVSEFGSQGLAA